MTDHPSTYRYSVFFMMESFLGMFADREQPWSYGGVEIQLYYLARAFARRGDTQVILLHDKPIDFQVPYENIEARQRRAAISKGVPVISRYINRARARQDLVFEGEHAFFIFGLLVPPVFLRELKAAGILPVYWLNGDSLVDGSGYLPPLSERLVSEQISLSMGFVTQNRTQQAALKERYGHNAPVIESAFENPFSGEHAQHINPGGKPSLLWIGRCDGVKRPWVVEQLAQLLPDIRIQMIMPERGNEGFFTALTHDLGRHANIELSPGIPHDELMRLFHEDVILINTSGSEGLPNTFIEAAFARRPFVSLEVDLGGLLDRDIAPGTKGLCAQGDLGVMAAQLRMLADDPALRAAIGEAAYQHAGAAYDSDRVADQWIDYLSALAKTSRNSST